MKNPDAVIVGNFKCLNCNKIYQCNQGLWSHKKLCKATALVVKVPVEKDLRAKIDNLESILMEMASNVEK